MAGTLRSRNRDDRTSCRSYTALSMIPCYDHTGEGHVTARPRAFVCSLPDTGHRACLLLCLSRLAQTWRSVTQPSSSVRPAEATVELVAIEIELRITKTTWRLVRAHLPTSTSPPVAGLRRHCSRPWRRHWQRRHLRRLISSHLREPTLACGHLPCICRSVCARKTVVTELHQPWLWPRCDRHGKLYTESPVHALCPS